MFELSGLGYDVTEYGDVISTRGLPMKPEIVKSRNQGYLRVCLKGKHVMVHRLVAEKYVPNPDNKPFVNHKDENTYNNHFSNLEWVTSQENAEYSKSTKVVMVNPNGETIEIFNLTKFCRDNNLTQANMWKVLVGERTHHKGWTKFESS